MYHVYLYFVYFMEPAHLHRKTQIQIINYLTDVVISFFSDIFILYKKIYNDNEYHLEIKPLLFQQDFIIQVYICRLIYAGHNNNNNKTLFVKDNFL